MKESDHLLTRSGLTHPEVSSKVFLGSFGLYSSVNIVSDHGLEDQEIEVRSPAEAKEDTNIKTSNING
jgi:hypothetical protein